MFHRLLAQEAASWYYGRLDPFLPNPENIKRHLRGPLLAVTLKALTNSSPLDPAGGSFVEEKKNNGGSTTTTSSDSNRHNWREYLQDSSHTKEHNQRAQEAYEALSRRTKARLEAFLAGCMLSVPDARGGTNGSNGNNKNNKNSSNLNGSDEFVNLQEGLAGFGISQGSSSDVSSAPSTLLSRRAAVQQPQMKQEDLILRLEVHIKTMMRIKNLREECVLAMEPPKAIKNRAKILTRAFVATAKCVRSLSPCLTRLLNCLTMEVLAVETLSPDLIKVIRRIASEYEHGTSFASLAFLSTPEVNADSLLTPLVVKYLKYLQVEWENLVKDCELERMLTQCVDPTMRKLFKTIEFQSIGHLLEICHEQRHSLQKIELAPNVCAIAENIHSLSNSKDALRQALLDLQREVITVNGHVLPPVTSRKELLHLLTQMLNSRTLTAEAPPKTAARRTSPRKLKPVKETPSGADSPPIKPSPDKENSSIHDGKVDYEDIIFSSDCETSGMSEAVDSSEGEPMTPKRSKKRTRRTSFHLSAIDALTRRLLIAGSRTGNGGDAYFVVRDLFGGEDVEVVPTNAFPLHGRMVRPGTIDILVRLASVTIKCHQTFDVYPRALVGECEPLIQFHATTTETINLREVRAASAHGSDDDSDNANYEDGTTTDRNSLLVIQEQHTPQTGFRTISIRPALYEKVEVWNTPS